MRQVKPDETKVQALPTRSGGPRIDNAGRAARGPSATRGRASRPYTQPTSQEGVVQRFVTQENIHRYGLLLEQKNSPEREALLKALLEDERAKLSAIRRNPGAAD